MTRPTTRIAVLGTGIMGAAMARNLLDAGFAVTVWNRTEGKARRLEPHGARVATDPGAAVRDADVLLTMLAHTGAVEAAMAAALPGLRPGQVWVQSSTVGIDGCDRLARLAAQHDLRYVDAPVLGTREPAEKGALTVLAAGPDDVREVCEPIFAAIGQRTRWLGDEVGRASRLKLVLNSWVLALTTATAEAMALADGLGLDRAEFLDVIAGGPLDVAYAQVKGKAIVAGAFPASFPVWGAAKDAGLIVDAAAAAGVRMGIAAAIRDVMTEARDAGHADEDMAAVYRVLRGERAED